MWDQQLSSLPRPHDSIQITNWLLVVSKEILSYLICAAFFAFLCRHRQLEFLFACTRLLLLLLLLLLTLLINFHESVR